MVQGTNLRHLNDLSVTVLCSYIKEKGKIAVTNPLSASDQGLQKYNFKVQNI
jgi:hypothetical protein